MIPLLIVQLVVFVLGVVLTIFGIKVATEEKGSVTAIGATTAALGVCASVGTLIYFLFGTLPQLLSP